MESSSFHELPPSKRFKLLHCQGHSADPCGPRSLPAKKRFGSFHGCRPTPSLCLPAKKRVWASSPFDDLDHQPHEWPEKEQLQEENAPAKAEEREVEEAAAEEEEEDDGVLCAVCRSTDGDPLDPIVFCDGCDLMVHASCYGSPLVDSVPEGDWFCSRCERRRWKEAEFDPACCLCPVRGGAMKPTADGSGWAHCTCPRSSSGTPAAGKASTSPASPTSGGRRLATSAGLPAAARWNARSPSAGWGSMSGAGWNGASASSKRSGAERPLFQDSAQIIQSSGRSNN